MLLPQRTSHLGGDALILDMPMLPLASFASFAVQLFLG